MGGSFGKSIMMSKFPGGHCCLVEPLLLHPCLQRWSRDKASTSGANTLFCDGLDALRQGSARGDKEEADPDELVKAPGLNRNEHGLLGAWHARRAGTMSFALQFQLELGPPGHNNLPFNML
jgi:hypothetical protein